MRPCYRCNASPARGAPADTEVIYRSANGVSGHGWAGLRLCVDHPHIGAGSLPTITQYEMEYVGWALRHPRVPSTGEGEGA